MTSRADGVGEPRIGVLLAAGRGSRFDPDGRLDKLLALIEGRPVVLHALESLAGAVDRVVAVVRPGARGEALAGRCEEHLAGAKAKVEAALARGAGDGDGDERHVYGGGRKERSLSVGRRRRRRKQ